MVEDINVWKNGGCTLVLWKSRRVERLNVVLIEKEGTNLVLADSDFRMPDYSDGGHGKDQLLKTSGWRSSLKVEQEERI